MAALRLPLRTGPAWRNACCAVLGLLVVACAAEPVARKVSATDSIDCTVDTGLPSVHCGAVPSVAFDSNGRIWAVFEQQSFVYLTRAENANATFGTPVKVNKTAEEIYINGENRPKIAFGRGDEIYVSWTRVIPGRFNGEIRFSRSLDGGETFDAVRTINDDGLVTGHRFETLFVDSRGNIYLAWLDKRDLYDLSEEERQFAGAAVYYTVSTDRGASFRRNIRVVANSCECCRIAAAETPDGNVALFFRQIFDQHVRDHGFAVVGPEGVVRPMVRATRDDWRIDACPHHGPTILNSGEGSYHLAWFTNSEQRKGIYYGRFDPERDELHSFMAVSNAASAAHPFLARSSDRLALVWKEFDGEKTSVYFIQSPDNGANWTARQALASTAGASDHPFLLANRSTMLLTWHTANDGLRIIDVGHVKFAGGR